MTELQQIQVIRRIGAKGPSELMHLDAIVEQTCAVQVIARHACKPAALATLHIQLAGTRAWAQLQMQPGGTENLPITGLSLHAKPIGALVDLLSTWHGGVKRAVDIPASSVLPLLAPVLLMCAICVEANGSPFFRQWCYGRGRRPYPVYDLHTMWISKGNLSSANRTLARDLRETRIGRSQRRKSLDQLPQLRNVLEGDIPLVSSRSHATTMRIAGKAFGDPVQAYYARHRTWRGITGWAQINGSRREVNTIEKARQRVEFDRWYIAHVSPAVTSGSWPPRCSGGALRSAPIDVA